MKIVIKKENFPTHQAEFEAMRGKEKARTKLIREIYIDGIIHILRILTHFQGFKNFLLITNYDKEINDLKLNSKDKLIKIFEIQKAKMKLKGRKNESISTI